MKCVVEWRSIEKKVWVGKGWHVLRKSDQGNLEMVGECFGDCQYFLTLNHSLLLPSCRCPMCSLNYQSEDQFVEHMVLQHTARLQETFTRLQGEVCIV